MKILSFDVGIRNLAFCYFEIPNELYKKDKEINQLIGNIKIIKWDIINLSNDEKNIICNGLNKNGKCCKSKALYKKKNIYYCKKHASETGFILPTRENTIKSIKKRKKQDIINYFNLISNNFFGENDVRDGNGLENKDYYIEKIQDILNKKSLENITNTNVSNLSIVSIGLSMKENLNKIFDSNDIDLILIENQISPIANRMKTIQGMLTQYFIMNNICNIQYISSSNKLKLFIQKKTTYKERKKAGIDIMNNDVLPILEKGKWIDTFTKHKKKDDLADSFLQSLYYLVN